MSHHHHAHGTGYDKLFAIGIALNVTYIIVETVYGFYVNSLALLADAGHNVSDVLGLGMAWGASYLSRIKPNERRTYGWRSTSILASLFNALTLLIAVGGIAWEAIRRFHSPEPVAAPVVMWVAGIGVVINTATALLFYRDRHHDLNIQGTFLHMAADACVSLGVVIAGLVIYMTGTYWIDSVTSLVVAFVILISTWGLLRDSFNLVLNAVPRGIKLEDVHRYLSSLPGVESVHDLHIWAMSTTETAITAHIVRPTPGNDDELLAEINHALHERFGIEHMTLQIERSVEAAKCDQADEDVI